MTGLIHDGKSIQPEQAAEPVTDLLKAADTFGMRRAGVIKAAFVFHRISMEVRDAHSHCVSLRLITGGQL
jgi:hypothetical protein